MLISPISTGSEVGYYFICPKKLWWFAHGVKNERGHIQVKLGKRVRVES